MKKKIAILGSTGSIGKTTINIIKRDKKNFDIVLLTTNNNFKEILKQAKEFKVQNLIINNKKYYSILKRKLKNKKINIYNNFEYFYKKFNKKIDYTMCAISGLAGLKPTLDSIKFSKKIAIANKESIICAWNLIQKELKKNKTTFIPVDSEHFSIWSLIDNSNIKMIEKIILTASGGPFLNWQNEKINQASPAIATKHPNWSMGKKISIDSATMMNKVFEVIEAQRIFNLDKSKFKILIHPKSYVHAIIKFRNGLTKILIHDTNMKIPIFNTLYQNTKTTIKTKKLDLLSLNNLNFNEVNLAKFPSVKILKMIPKKISLFETVLVSANDEVVDLFLNKKITFMQIYPIIKKILNFKEFSRYKYLYPKNVDQIYELDKYVRLKTKSFCINYIKW